MNKLDEAIEKIEEHTSIYIIDLAHAVRDEIRKPAAEQPAPEKFAKYEIVDEDDHICIKCECGWKYVKVGIRDGRCLNGCNLRWWPKDQFPKDIYRRKDWFWEREPATVQPPATDEELGRLYSKYFSGHFGLRFIHNDGLSRGRAEREAEVAELRKKLAAAKDTIDASMKAIRALQTDSAAATTTISMLKNENEELRKKGDRPKQPANATDEETARQYATSLGHSPNSSAGLERIQAASNAYLAACRHKDAQLAADVEKVRCEERINTLEEFLQKWPYTPSAVGIATEMLAAAKKETP